MKICFGEEIPLRYEEICLDLAAGDRPYLDGTDVWIHNDIRDLYHIEKVCDVFDCLADLSDDSVSKIRCTHFLEHLSHNDNIIRSGLYFLEEIKRVLKPSGTLYIEVPNLKGHVQNWIEGNVTDKQFAVYLYGEQDHIFNHHLNGFTDYSLNELLRKAGFGSITIEDVGLVLCSLASKEY